jgi:DNA polymerase lambda
MFKIKQYKKAISAISYSTIKIKSLNNVKEILKSAFKDPKKIVEKINEYIETGDVVEVHLNDKSSQIASLTQIPGIGVVKATKLIDDHGIKSLQMLRQNNTYLTRQQKIGLKYFEKDYDKIPRQEIKDYEVMLRKFKPKGLSFEIVGSYRRGNSVSGDIDILVTTKEDDLKIYHDFITLLSTSGLLLENMTYGKSKWIGYAKPDKVNRRVDIMHCPVFEYPFSILYFTGSGAFNEKMRYKAKIMGFRLSEHGIKSLKENSYIVGLTTEKKIFQFLKIPYLEPQNRVSFASVI